MNKNLIHEMAKIEDNYWWFKQKRHLIDSILVKYLNKNKQTKLLDCGCGTGKTLELLQNYGNAYGSDLDDDCINYCIKRGFKNIAKQDITKPIVFKEKFDAIIVTDVLEHVEDDKKALEQLTNALKTNGILIITVPAHQWMFGTWDVMLHHKRRHSVKSVKMLLKTQKNLQEIKVNYYNLQSFFPALVSRFVVMKTLKPKSQFWNTPPVINKLLTTSGIIDNFLALVLPIYFGLSVYAVAKKTK